MALPAAYPLRHLHGVFMLRVRHCVAIIGTMLLTSCATTTQTAPTPTVVAPAVPEVQAPVAAVIPPAYTALRTMTAMQDRLYRIGAPLLVNNTDLCKGNARKLLGFTAKNKYSYTSEFDDAAARSFGLGERLQIMGVLAGSGAAMVGLRAADVLVAVDNKPMPEGPNAERLAATILGPLVNTRSSVKLTLVRQGATLMPTVPLTLACAFGIELGNADNVNAYSDGKRVMLTRGMMGFVRTDTELAYVIAREMAHSALGHPGRLRMSATFGGIIDNLIRIHPDLSTMGGMSGIKPFAQDLDAAADTVALYMLARAGYAIDGVPSFWQRLASQYPATVLNGYTAIHPATGYRMVAMARAITAIQTKKAANLSLLP